MIAMVTYKMDVVAYVDTETRAVTKVVTDNDAITLADPIEVLDGETSGPVDDATQTLAVEIAEAVDWPAWDHGY